MNPAGWYYAEGDPAGTTRYWDGQRWVGEPVVTPTGPTGGGYVDSRVGSRFPIASTGARFGGRAIDLVILFVIGFIVLQPFLSDFIDGIDLLGPEPTQDEVQRLVESLVNQYSGRFLMSGLIIVAWDFLWVALAGGTPGKLMVGTRVARADTGETPPGFGKAALRSLNRVAGIVPVLGFFLVVGSALASLIMLFVDDQHRTVMDRIAGTVVVNKQ